MYWQGKDSMWMVYWKWRGFICPSGKLEVRWALKASFKSCPSGHSIFEIQSGSFRRIKNLFCSPMIMLWSMVEHFSKGQKVGRAKFHLNSVFDSWASWNENSDLKKKKKAMSSSPSSFHPHTTPWEVILVKGYVPYSSIPLLDTPSTTIKRLWKSPEWRNLCNPRSLNLIVDPSCLQNTYKYLLILCPKRICGKSGTNSRCFHLSLHQCLLVKALVPPRSLPSYSLLHFPWSFGVSPSSLHWLLHTSPWGLNVLIYMAFFFFHYDFVIFQTWISFFHSI